MIGKIAVFGVATAIWFLPVASHADSRSSFVNSIQAINTREIPNGSIVIISREESGVPGYVHERYAFVDQACPGGAQIVDHSGPPIDPSDANLHWLERTMCADLRLRMND